LSRIGRFFKDYMQLGYVQSLKLSLFREKWLQPDRVGPVEWWYLGTGKYYHYFAERWGKDDRVSWKIDKREWDLTGIDHFAPQEGADQEVGVLLTEEIVGGV
jgi:hypothetical protein